MNEQACIAESSFLAIALGRSNAVGLRLTGIYRRIVVLRQTDNVRMSAVIRKCLLSALRADT